MRILIICLCSIVFVLTQTQISFGDTVMITASEKASHVIFDGKWTTKLEWKPTSLNEIKEPHTIIRSAHYEEFLYLMIDVLHDKTTDLHSDSATVCFDTLNDKSQIPDENDYCFSVSTGSVNGITLQGGGQSPNKSFFKRIQNNDGFIAIGTMSDENDRYEGDSHSSYEFRIPLEVIGRSDNYGFLVFITDTDREIPITWPENIENKNNKIPSPLYWGELISPDKSLPEFEIPMIILISSIFSIIGLTRLQKFI